MPIAPRYRKIPIMAILSRCTHVTTYPARRLPHIAFSPSLMTGALLSRLDLWNKGEKSTFFIWSLATWSSSLKGNFNFNDSDSDVSPSPATTPHSPIRYKTNTIQLGYRPLYVENHLIWYWSKDPYLAYQDPDPLSPPRREVTGGQWEVTPSFSLH